MLEEKCACRNTILIRYCVVEQLSWLASYFTDLLFLSGTDPCKNHTKIILIFFNEKKNNNVKLIISSNVVNHITIVI